MTDKESEELRKMIGHHPPKVVADEDITSGFLICTDNMEMPGVPTVCSRCGKSIKVLNSHPKLERICPACALRLSKANEPGMHEHCITPSMLSDLQSALFVDKRRN